MVDYPIGDLVAEQVRAMGVKPFYKHFKHDGVSGPNMATVYSDRGQGLRAPVVFYNRSNEAAAQLKPGDFDWKAIFVEGVRWFHSGGIFAALSPTTSELIVEAMQAAKEAGAVTSFDLNYRAKLWNVLGGPEKAVEKIARIVKNVDVLVGNEEDLQMGLGIPGTGSCGEIQTGPKRLLRHDGHGAPEASASEDRGHHSARSALHESTQLERRGLDQRHDPPGAHRSNSTYTTALAAGTATRPGSSTDLLNGDPEEEAVRLGWAHGALADILPRRHDHGNTRPGATGCQGRIGPHSALVRQYRQVAARLLFVTDCSVKLPTTCHVDGAVSKPNPVL